MTPEEIAAIRKRSRTGQPFQIREDVETLLAEVERLRGERDEIAAAAGTVAYERDQLQARLDKVRALVINRRIAHTRTEAVAVIGEVVDVLLDGGDQP